MKDFMDLVWSIIKFVGWTALIISSGYGFICMLGTYAPIPILLLLLLFPYSIHKDNQQQFEKFSFCIDRLEDDEKQCLSLYIRAEIKRLAKLFFHV